MKHDEVCILSHRVCIVVNGTLDSRDTFMLQQKRPQHKDDRDGIRNAYMCLPLNPCCMNEVYILNIEPKKYVMAMYKSKFSLAIYDVRCLQTTCYNSYRFVWNFFLLFYKRIIVRESKFNLFYFELPWKSMSIIPKQIQK